MLYLQGYDLVKHSTESQGIKEAMLCFFVYNSAGWAPKSSHLGHLLLRFIVYLLWGTVQPCTIDLVFASALINLVSLDPYLSFLSL